MRKGEGRKNESILFGRKEAKHSDNGGPQANDGTLRLKRQEPKRRKKANQQINQAKFSGQKHAK